MGTSNLSTVLIIAFVIYIAAFNQLGNYAKIATTSGWSGTPPSGSSSATASSAGSTLSTIGSATSGIGSIIKSIPLIGSLF